MLKILKKHRREIFFWVVLLVLAPVAIELLIVANLMGAEVAVLFFTLLMKDRWLLLLDRWDRCKAYIGCVYFIILSHSVSQPRLFVIHASTSVVLFALTGSTAYATVVWYPLMLFGGDPCAWVT